VAINPREVRYEPDHVPIGGGAQHRRNGLRLPDADLEPDHGRDSRQLRQLQNHPAVQIESLDTAEQSRVGLLQPHFRL
jgi:hypothetical protein